MTYKPHQIKSGKEIAAAMRANNFFYCAGDVRCGKTATVLYALTLLDFKSILVLTKKAAISGWHSEIERTGFDRQIHVTNFEQIKNLNGDDYDVVICDESHVIGSVGKPSKRFRELRALAWDKPYGACTGTPVAETPCSLYYQTAASKYGPFSRFKTFYKFFAEYGVPEIMYISGRAINQYKKCKPKLMDEFGRFAVTITQADAGIVSPIINRTHAVSVSPITKDLIRQAKKSGVVTLGDDEVILESDMAVRLFIHQAEFGAVLVDGEYIHTGCLAIVDYIKRQWGDDPSVGIMTHYRSTRSLFEKHFKNVELYSSNADAEGVNLAHLNHLIICGTDFSGAKHHQRINRQANLTDGGRKIVVNHIITSSGISWSVYDAVSQKRDFSLAAFRQWRSA